MIFSFYLNRRSKIRILILAAGILSIKIFSFQLCMADTRAVILADPAGNAVYTFNPDAPMIPASTLKLLTSLVALKTLGPDYRFHTQVAFDQDTRTLYVKGFGDPLLISEELYRLARQVAATYRPEQIRKIVMDNSFFSPEISIPGTGRSKNPYDATTGALCANFNTIHFKWSAKKKTYESAEPQTPYLDIFTPEIRGSGLQQGRLLLSEPFRPKYPGLLLANFLAGQQVAVTGDIQTGQFCEDCPHTMIFESAYDLGQVVEKLMAFSNNFIANQVMLALGAEIFGPPATLEKGVLALTDYAKNHLGFDQIRVVEGSGLSRKNRISARQMIHLLTAFAPYHTLLKHKETEFYKTGTLSDVRTRAGYFKGKDKKLYPYVIMLNSTATGYEKILTDIRQKVAKISLEKD